MLSYIYRLVSDFEHEHGIHPNLLYLNRHHIVHLKSSFAEGYTLQQIMAILGMELIIEEDIMHPHANWTNVAQSRIAC
jgi:hypothetical protein